MRIASEYLIENRLIHSSMHNNLSELSDLLYAERHTLKLSYGNYLVDALEKACELNHTKVVQILLQYNILPTSNALLCSIYHQNHSLVNDFINKNVDLDEALLEACKRSSSFAAIYLIENGVNLNKVDQYNRTSLSYIIETNNFPVFQALLKRDPNLNQAFSLNIIDGVKIVSRPLPFAVQQGMAEMVALLIKRGAEVDLLDNFGYTSLMYAAINGNWRMVKLLIDNGADINYSCQFENIYKGHTPIIAAMIHKQTSVIKYLIASGVTNHQNIFFGKQKVTDYIFSKCYDLELIRYIELFAKDMGQEDKTQKFKTTGVNFAAKIYEIVNTASSDYLATKFDRSPNFVSKIIKHFEQIMRFIYTPAELAEFFFGINPSLPSALFS